MVCGDEFLIVGLTVIYCMFKSSVIFLFMLYLNTGWYETVVFYILRLKANWKMQKQCVFITELFPRLWFRILLFLKILMFLELKLILPYSLHLWEGDDICRLKAFGSWKSLLSLLQPTSPLFSDLFKGILHISGYRPCTTCHMHTHTTLKSKYDHSRHKLIMNVYV